LSTLILAALLALAGATPRTVPVTSAPPPQATPALAVAPDPDRDHRAVLRLGPILGDEALQQAARSGLPLRLRYRVELWKEGRLTDQLAGSEAWSAVLLFEPLGGAWLVRSRSGSDLRRDFDSYEAARAALERAYVLALHPTSPGRYYYTASVEVETLSLSDLEELERWLKGELRPAVSGNRSIPGAIAQGFKRLFIRVLRLPNRQVEARSPRFDVR